MAVARSHRLLDPKRDLRSKEVTNHFRNAPYFENLFRAGLPHRERLIGPIGCAADVEIEVVEFTGRAGDIWLMDMRVLHAPAPNAGATPRLVVSQNLLPRSIQERYAPGLATDDPQTSMSVQSPPPTIPEGGPHDAQGRP